MSESRVVPWSFVFVFAIAVGSVAAACGAAGGEKGGGRPNGSESGVDGGDPDADFDVTDPPDTFEEDTGLTFPPATTPPCDAATLGTPKLAYPLDGILFPPNLNVLEVQFTRVPGATLYEVDFTNTITNVKVITKCTDVPNVRGGPSLGCGVTLSKATWDAVVTPNKDGAPVSVSVRATGDGSCITTSAEKVGINFAKEDLKGGIFYWQSAVYGGAPGKTGGIYSHDFGTADPTPTPFYTSGTSGTCVGCHNLSRDGARISVGIDDPDADDEFGDVTTQVMDVATRTVFSGGGSTWLGTPSLTPGFQTWTHDHSRMVASHFDEPGIFFGTSNQGFDIFDGNGKTLVAAKAIGLGLKVTQPDLSRDDKYLAYVAAAVGTIPIEGDHHFLGGSLYWSTFDVPTNTIGPPQLFQASGGRNYYYPSFSPDGAFVAFNDAPGQDSFYNRNARVKLMHFPAKVGEKPIDLPALNVSDGLTNSWPRWSPFVTTYQGHRLLWLTFSSNRNYGLRLVNKGFDNGYPPDSPSDPKYGDLPTTSASFDKFAEPQIWMAAVVVDSVVKKEFGEPEGVDRSFPAFWLPFQDVNSHNHCAQWVDKVVFKPPPPPTDAGPPPCVPNGGSCAAGACCSDVVCCSDKTCRPVCIK